MRLAKKLFGDRWGVVIRSKDTLMFKIIRAKSKERAAEKARRFGDVLKISRLPEHSKAFEFRIEHFSTR